MEPPQPQRFCSQCGAEIRSGTSFCVSCGAPLPFRGHQDNYPPQRDNESSVRSEGTDLFKQFKISWFSLDKRIRWSLPGGLLLGLLTLLGFISPITQWVAIVALGVSVVNLIVKAVRRKSLKAWSISTAALFLLVTVFSGFSINGLFGSFGNSTETDQPVAFSDSGNMSTQAEGIDLDDPSSVNTPNFMADTLEEQPLGIDEGKRLFIIGKTETLYEEDIVAIADSIDEQTTEYDLVEVDLLWSPTDFGGSPEDHLTDPYSDMCTQAYITISNSPPAELMSDVEQGHYEYGCV